MEGDACIKSITSVNFISWDYMGINGFLWEFKKKSLELDEYLLNNSNTPKTFRDHHLFVYNTTVNNTQIYQCYWCNVSVKVQYDALPRKNNLELDKCLNSNDYIHYMYYQIDKNKNVYMTCLKCNKNSFI